MGCSAWARALGALAIVVSLAALGTSAAGAGARREAKLLSPAAIQGGSIAIHDSIARATAPLSRWGGAVTASTGETVTVYVSSSYAADATVTQQTADFLASLYHGPELQQATFYLVPADEVQRLCGGGDDGCYLPSQRELIVPGQDLPDGTSVETILAHEYGHFIAANRSNAPWAALDYGPKRWASVENVCARTKAGTAFPGNEAEEYARNPGEAWAETYRLLNFRHLALPGWQAAPWIVDQSFAPDAAAFDAAIRDVLDPWQGPTTTHWSGTLAQPASFRPPLTNKKARRRHLSAVAEPTATHTIKTPNDGALTISLDSAPTGSTMSLTDSSGRILDAGVGGTLTFTICGQRSVTLTVAAPKAGAVAATLSVP